MIVSLIERIYALLWGDLIHVPLPGGDSVGISLLIILLIPTGICFTVRTKVLPLRLFPDMIRALMSKKENKDSLSTFQTLIVSTATRVGMGNLVGVVAAISGRRCRSGLLDVGDSLDWLFNSICRGNAGTDSQRKRSTLRRIPWRPGLLYSSLYGRKDRKKEKSYLDCCSVCNFRSDLLVWNQPGNQ